MADQITSSVAVAGGSGFTGSDQSLPGVIVAPPAPSSNFSFKTVLALVVIYFGYRYFSKGKL